MKLSLQRFAPKNTLFLKRVLTLSSASLFSQIVSLAIIPILTRMYAPEDFGHLALFLSYSAILSVVFTLRFEQAILLPRTEKNVIAVLSLSVGISILFAILTTVIILLLLYFSKEHIVGSLDAFLPLAALLFSLHKICNNYLNRIGNYNLFALNTFFFSVGQASFKLFFGILGGISSGLILGVVVGRTISFLIFIVFIAKYIGALQYKLKWFVRIKRQAKRYKKFATWLLASDLLSAFAIQSPFILTAYFFDNKTLGYFSLAYSFTTIPLQFIGGAVGNVFRAEAAKNFQEVGSCVSLYKELLKNITIVLTPIFILAYFISSHVFSFIFGDEWASSGHIVSLLLPMIFFQFIARVFSYIFILKEKQKENLIIQVLLILLILFSFYTGAIYFNGFDYAISFFSFSYSVVYLYVIVRGYQLAKPRKAKINVNL